MNAQTHRFITEAETAIKNSNYIDASRYYEKAAETVIDKTQAADLLIKASETYRNNGMYKDALKCYQNAAQLLYGEEKAKCLMSCWEALIEAIVHFE